MDNFEAVETHGDNHVAGWVTTSDNTKLWVNVHGRGHPVVFLHGWTMSSTFWQRQLSLADHFQLITMDLRGHGRSHSVLRGHTIARYARDLHDMLHALHLRDITLLGWSMGGSVVMDYWQQFGNECIKAIALVETTPCPMSDAPWNTHHLHGSTAEDVTLSLAQMTQARTAFGESFINAMFLSGQAPPHALQWMLAEHMETTDQTATAIYQDYAGRDYTGVLPTISVPCMAVYGRSRHMCFGPSTGRYVAGSIPNARFAILDKSGHLPFYEEPDIFNDTLAHFLTQLPA